MSASVRPQLPPEEKFWQRYSPHNEFPLSTVGSITIYLLIGIMVVAGIKLNLFEPKPNPPIAWDTIRPDGDDPNALDNGNPGAARDGIPGVPAIAPPPGAPLPLPAPGKADPLDLPPDDPNDSLLKEFSTLFPPMPAPVPGNRPGQPGGDPNGANGGTNGNNGGQRGVTSTARPAPQRWNLVFNTQNGEDYRRQLQGMNAILVIPAAQGKVRVIRNLTAPVSPAVEDPRTLTGIGWRDDRPESIADLAGALGLSEVPPFIFAFFPPEIEAKLRKLEQDFATRAGRQPRQIKETRFTVNLNRRTNQYEMVVTDQR